MYSQRNIAALQQRLVEWLDESVEFRASRMCSGLAAVLSTDIGLEREENQDRVVAFRGGVRSCVAVVVADGMGGMRDGGRCASIAVAGFLGGLLYGNSRDTEHRAISGVFEANELVYQFASGKGGATLSAVVMGEDRKAFLVHVGDTRVYAFGDKVQRLTVDDSLAEAVGGDGRELIQFVGMGSGITPHIMAVPNSVEKIAITSDGIHYIDHSTLSAILQNARDMKTAAARLAAIARWCGGHDNATSALIDMVSLHEEMRDKRPQEMRFWTPAGELQAFINEEGFAAENGQRQVMPNARPVYGVVKEVVGGSIVRAPEHLGVGNATLTPARTYYGSGGAVSVGLEPSGGGATAATGVLVGRTAVTYGTNVSSAKKTADDAIGKDHTSDPSARPVKAKNSKERQKRGANKSKKKSGEPTSRPNFQLEIAIEPTGAEDGDDRDDRR